MTMQHSCPGCQHRLTIEDRFAGQEIACPQCGQRFQAPRSTDNSGLDQDEQITREPWPRGAGIGAERPAPDYDELDEPAYDVRRRGEGWGTALAGLSLMFWTGIVVIVLAGASQIAGMALGTNPQAFQPGAQGAAPELMALTLGMAVLGCGMLLAMIAFFVGMCLCCTVPPESGARRWAIATVAAVVVLVVLTVIVMIIGLGTAIRGLRAGPNVPVGPMPFSPAFFMVIAIGGTLANIAIASLWLMFHKAMGDYFGNQRLSRGAVGLLAVYIVCIVTGQIIQFFAHPALLRGDFMTPPEYPALLVVAQLFGVAWLVGLSGWFLYLVHDTRRTILDHVERA